MIQAELLEVRGDVGLGLKDVIVGFPLTGMCSDQVAAVLVGEGRRVFQGRYGKGSHLLTVTRNSGSREAEDEGTGVGGDGILWIA